MNVKYLLSVLILPLLISTCQYGRVDRFIIDTFAGNTHSPQEAIETKENSASSPQSNENGSGLEVPSYTKDQIILRRIAYTTCYDAQNKIPKWVAWHLTANHTTGEQRRLSNFIVDEDVTSPRAELVDYKGSNYDRGHMCPAGDNKWAFEPMRESFYLTNICPQDHNLNCGDWNELEISCREWANKYGDIYIVAGPVLYRCNHETIGPNKVTVPEAFFKVVLCMQGTPKAIGFIYKNQRCNNAQSYYVNSVDEVERITGIDFFPSLPDNIENEVEGKASLNEW